MKIRITHTIEVDVDRWIQTYGDEPKAIRESVKNYCFGQLAESAAANEGCIEVVS